MTENITVTEAWRQAYPQAHIGLLLMAGIDNRRRISPLEEYKRQLEGQLRQRYQGYDRPALLQIEELQAYRNYYRSFGNTYHVQLQLESVISSGKSLPSVSPLVDACFAAELETLILTASHDADKLAPPIEIDIARGDEQIVQLSGAQKTAKAGDMLMRDANGAACTVLYGQDRSSYISPTTSRPLYVAYVPAGIPEERVYAHLRQIQTNVRLFAPQAKTVSLSVLGAV